MRSITLSAVLGGAGTISVNQQKSPFNFNTSDKKIGENKMAQMSRVKLTLVSVKGSCHKRQKPQAPIRNRQTRKVTNAKGLTRNTNLA